jgi:hypothetical protein
MQIRFVRPCIRRNFLNFLFFCEFRKNSFRLKNRLKRLVKSSECRAKLNIVHSPTRSCSLAFRRACARRYLRQPKPNLNAQAMNLFRVSTCEKSSQPNKHANKIIVSIFLTMMVTILDTHGIVCA